MARIIKEAPKQAEAIMVKLKAGQILETVDGKSVEITKSDILTGKRFVEKKDEKVLDNSSKTRENVLKENLKMSQRRHRGRVTVKESIKKEDEIEAIRRAFKADLGSEEIELSSYNKGESPFGYGYSFEGDADNRESEWVVFSSEEDAEREAVAKVRNDLEYEPSIFTQSWLQNFVYITETDKRIIAGEEADYYVEDMSDEDLLEEADLLSDWEALEENINALTDEFDELDSATDEISPEELVKNRERRNEILEERDQLEKEREELVEQAKETVQYEKYEDIKEALEDPIEYFVNEQGTYRIEDLFEASFISIDFEEASQDAVDTDGVDHFLDRYDSKVEEITDPETGDTFYAYGIN